uniref:Uncharacterized protein n=1 Tax=Timema cristinae TaxID=61476 RepID=A0A7R9CTE3_TIMCR|nr:unnamed protein product [Timema cristinae]
MTLSYKLHHSGTKQGISLTLTDYTMTLSYKLHHSGTKQGSSLTLTDYTMTLSHSGTKQDGAQECCGGKSPKATTVLPHPAVVRLLRLGSPWQVITPSPTPPLKPPPNIPPYQRYLPLYKDSEKKCP